jgi:hypothetical protein
MQSRFANAANASAKGAADQAPTLDEVPMNRFKAIGSAFLLVPAMALLSTPAHAEFKCNSPTWTFDRTACEKAKEGPDALRRCVQRMEGIANLQFSDYVDEARAAAWAENDSSRTALRKAPVQSARFEQENPGA